MLSLKQYMSQHKGPSTKAVKVKIIKAKETSMSRQMALADTGMAIRAIVSNDSSLLKEDSCVVLRNCSLGRNALIINKSTNVSTTSRLNIPESIVEMAKNLIDPAVPETKMISEINEDTPLTTVQGIIDQVYLNMGHFI